MTQDDRLAKERKDFLFGCLFVVILVLGPGISMILERVAPSFIAKTFFVIYICAIILYVLSFFQFIFSKIIEALKIFIEEPFFIFILILALIKFLLK